MLSCVKLRIGSNRFKRIAGISSIDLFFGSVVDSYLCSGEVPLRLHDFGRYTKAIDVVDMS